MTHGIKVNGAKIFPKTKEEIFEDVLSCPGVLGENEFRIPHVKRRFLQINAIVPSNWDVAVDTSSHISTNQEPFTPRFRKLSNALIACEQNKRKVFFLWTLHNLW